MTAAKQIGPIRKVWYQWKALRLPWRKRFLVGLDLQGNTYWEFRLVRPSAQSPSDPDSRLRRIVHYPRSTPYDEVIVPPAWHQWLRYQRPTPPTIAEQRAEEARRERAKQLAAEADARWEAKPRVSDVPGRATGQAVPALNTGRTQPQERVAREAPTPNETAEVTEKKDDPWRRGRSTGPGEAWQPEAWSPTPAKKR
ncbi:hypothetical protein F5Y04DRAFT_271870 [Hypomontagnella monticulosa]|nr:hypothetical protein F5Y04DRAFT_271870 [Hypomontagnella monticulosa]